MDRSILAASKLSPGRARLIRPRLRVILDNDFSGDPDDLFQLVHHVLCPSVEIVGIIGSHLAVGDKYDASMQQATNAVARVVEVLETMGLSDEYAVFEGSNSALAGLEQAQVSDASEMIVMEAMRTDTDLPLLVLCGGGLTDLASAWLTEPGIARHLTAMWVGGPEYAGLATPPPGAPGVEYNTAIDLLAAQVMFNRSDIDLWQIPRNVYRQYLMSFAELACRVRPHGPIGEYLYQSIEHEIGTPYPDAPATGLGETYVMGDSPLVTFTALQAAYHPDTSSSKWVQRPAPIIGDDGRYVDDPQGRSIRVYTWGDVRLTFEDLYLKLEMFARP
jgi:inosine-uridine nucleoside N-ribohydrolase